MVTQRHKAESFFYLALLVLCLSPDRRAGAGNGPVSLGEKGTRELTGTCTLLRCVILEPPIKLGGSGALSCTGSESSVASSPSYCWPCRSLVARGLGGGGGSWLFARWLLTSGAAAVLPLWRFFFFFFASVVHLSMARITIPKGIVG